MGDLVKTFEDALKELAAFGYNRSGRPKAVELWPDVKEALLNGAARPDSALLAALEAWYRYASSPTWISPRPPTALREAYDRWKAEHGARAEAERSVVEAAKALREVHDLPARDYGPRGSWSLSGFAATETFMEAVDALLALDRPKPRYVAMPSGKVIDVTPGLADSRVAQFFGIDAENAAREHAARLNAAAEGRP